MALNQTTPLTFKLGANITTKYSAVFSQPTALGDILLTTAAGQFILGSAMETANALKGGAIATSGVVKMIAGGAVVRGQIPISAGSGRITSTDYDVANNARGVCLESGTAGDSVSVLLF